MQNSGSVLNSITDLFYTGQTLAALVLMKIGFPQYCGVYTGVLLSLVHTCDFSSPLRLFCEKMGVQPNCIISHNKIARAQNV